MSHPIIEIALKRPVVFDGAMGTEIQRHLSLGSFPGSKSVCNEALVFEAPDLIMTIHRAYLQAGCDVIETNTFGANAIVLAEYGLEEKVFEINREAARIGKEAAKEFGGSEKGRFVAGSVGPGTRLPSLGQVGFQELYRTYVEQVKGLLEGGVDAIVVETCQDPLQARAAAIAAADAMKEVGRRVPIFCLITVEAQGRMLLGTEPLAALVTLARHCDVFGMNCSTGPDAMTPVLREISGVCPKPMAVLPNAGLPVNEGGKLVYRLGPKEFASYMGSFVEELGVSFVGGCCGTTPDHIAALVEEVKGRGARPRKVVFPAAATSLYSVAMFDQDPKPLIVGERTNAQGSKAFREALEASDFEGMLKVARSQADEGAHMLDVAVALTGRDEKEDLRAFVARLRTEVDLPLVVDSTNPEAIEAALEEWPGRAVVNSVNLEDGGKRLAEIAKVARRHGAAIVALCITESGMCKRAEEKVECAKRLVRILTGEYGFEPQDIFLDPLTFTLGSGDPELKDSAKETLEAIRRIKAELPGVYTWLGVSNVSFGLAPKQRRILNSVFLHHALRAGLDAAILNAGKILPLAEIPEDLVRLAEDLIFARGEEPLRAFLEAGLDKDLEEEAKTEGEGSVEERLYLRVIKGQKDGLAALIDEALQRMPALEVLNKVLLAAMKEVGDRFASGEMQLPFVLRAAEVVKAAMGYLEPHIGKKGQAKRGTLVLATVRGDVHDIGKNLVDILVSNNGFRVVNLGTRQPIQSILEAADRERADAIGLSGLLVQSVMVMREDLMEMERQRRRIPVLLGGAALTRAYVEEDLKGVYSGPVIYCKDAFEGLKAMEAIVEGQVEVGHGEGQKRISGQRGEGEREKLKPLEEAEVPDVEAFGTKVIFEPPIEEVAKFISRVALFRGQWGFKKGRRTEEEWWDFAEKELEPMLQDRLARWYREGVFRPAAVYGLFPANSEGDVVIVYGEGGGEVARFLFPRLKGRSLADYLLPKSHGRFDVLGALAVTLGPGVARAEQELFTSGEYTEYLFLHGLGVELTEALAEWTHKRIREEMGIASEDGKDPQDIVRGAYRGARYSFGYPSCPDLTQQKTLLDLLGASRIGITLTENFEMVPEMSVSAIVFHHPASSRRGS